jgi:hypothetical protein
MQTSSGPDVELFTPKGKYFNASDCHVSVNNPEHFNSDRVTSAMVWKRALLELRKGLSDCADCERCGT